MSLWLWRAAEAARHSERSVEQITGRRSADQPPGMRSADQPPEMRSVEQPTGGMKGPPGRVQFSR